MLEAMNFSVALAENFLLKEGGLIETPHGATSVSTGMFIFGYQCCW